ncbi:MAG: hypothetical protein ACE5H4_01030 [Candidatus Thorarchaeota archaeon]
MARVRGADDGEEVKTARRSCGEGRKDASSGDYDSLETRESATMQELEFLVTWAAQVSGVIV